MSGDRALRIGEVARRTGTTPRTIRYYEEIGLLTRSDSRQPGAHRTYDDADVERLAQLLELKELLGITLDELRELAAAESARAGLRREWHKGIEDPVRRRQVLEESSGLLDRQLELVRKRRDAIADLEADLVARRRRVKDALRSLEEKPAER